MRSRSELLASGALLPALAAAALGAVAGLLIFDGVAEANYVTALILLGLVVPVLALPLRAAAATLAALTATWFVVYLAIKGVPHVIDPAPQVSAAVGGAAYTGVAYQGPQIAVVLALGGLVAATGALAWRFRARLVTLRGAAEEPPSAADPAPRDRRALYATIAAGAVVTVVLLPAVRLAFGPPGVPYYSPAAWDAANVTVWEEFIRRGLIGMNEFFYPYGGQWIFQLVPLGPSLKWVAEGLMVAIAGWSLWRLSGGRALKVALCLVVLAIVGFSDEATVWRYLPALLVPLSYAALGPLGAARPWRPQVVFGATCLLAGSFEADLLLYGLAGVVLVILGDIFSGRVRKDLKRGAEALAIDLLPALVAVALVLAFWALTGSLDGNLRFFGGLQAVSATSAVNPFIGALAGYSARPTAAAIELATPALLLVSGLAYALLAPRPRRDVVSVLLAASGVTLVFALKTLNRYIDDQAVVLALLALGWCAVLLADRRRLVAAAALGAFGATAIFGLKGAEDRLASTDFLRGAVHAPKHLGEVGESVFSPGGIRQVAAERIAYRNFPGYADVTAARDYQRAVHRRGSAVPPFVVLGNAQLLYGFLDKDPPYQVDLYDGAPMAEQEKMVEELADRRPPYLVWTQESLIDEVPYTVRAPLVYRFLVESYVPFRLYPDTRVLRLRREGEPIAASFWREALGPLDLAFVPSYSSGVEASACDGGSGCNPYVVLEGPEPDSVEVLGVQLSGPHGPFEVKLRSKPGQTRYAIRLDRLWFAPLLGPSPRLRSEVPGWEARIEDLQTGDDLY